MAELRPSDSTEKASCGARSSVFSPGPGKESLFRNRKECAPVVRARSRLVPQVLRESWVDWSRSVDVDEDLVLRGGSDHNFAMVFTRLDDSPMFRKQVRALQLIGP